MNNRKDLNDWKYRKKSIFKPIMLTSKQMKPVERSSFVKSNEKKISEGKSKIIQNNDEYRYRYAYSKSSYRTEFIKKLTEQYRESLIKKITNGNDETTKSIPLPTNVVKVEFQRKQTPAISQSRYEQLMDFDNAQIRTQKKFMYLTNVKTYDSFSRVNKVKFRQNKLALFKRQHTKTDQQEQKWDSLMKTHYLNVKKVLPKKKSNQKMQVSPQKMQQISRKVQQYQNSLMQRFDGRYRSTTVMITRKNPQKQSFTTQIPISQQNKIQEEILAKRQSPNKRQYFVFGMGQTSSKGNAQYKFQLYKDFLWKINFTNGIYVKIKDQIDYPYKMFVGYGNNSMLIKGIAKRRPWWQIVDKINQDTNVVWTQLKVNDYFGYQREYEEKKKLFSVKNRKIHSSLDCTHGRKSPLKEEPTERVETLEAVENDLNSTIMLGDDYELWSKHYKTFKKYEDRFENYMGKRVKTLVRNKNLLYVADSSKLKTQNHFPCNYFLGNKKALFYSLRKYYELNGRDPFQYIPTTFHISKGADDPEYHRFLTLFEELTEKKKKKQTLNIWILKPGEFTNRGKGITVCPSLDDIKIRLKGREKCSNGKLRTFILQKYIEKPLLYNKRKFDIRHFMLMTCINGKFKGYWFNEGYIRTSSFEYNNKNCKDLYTHLTNDSIQQNSQDYGKYEKGNKLSYSQFQKYLTQQFRKSKVEEEKYDFYKSILPQMKAIAKDTMEATYMRLSPRRLEHNFELFGLDFMLDENFNLYLIEVNTNPCLEISCPLLSRILPSLVENLFKICIDPIFPPAFEWPAQKKYQLGENALEENKFTIIFDENTEGERLKKMYEKVDLNNGMGDIDEEEEEYEDEGKEWVED